MAVLKNGVLVFNAKWRRERWEGVADSCRADAETAQDVPTPQ